MQDGRESANNDGLGILINFFKKDALRTISIFQGSSIFSLLETSINLLRDGLNKAIFFVMEMIPFIVPMVLWKK